MKQKKLKDQYMDIEEHAQNTNCCTSFSPFEVHSCSLVMPVRIGFYLNHKFPHDHDLEYFWSPLC